MLPTPTRAYHVPHTVSIKLINLVNTEYVFEGRNKRMDEVEVGGGNNLCIEIEIRSMGWRNGGVLK